jgi:hypothetical protein
MVFDDGPPEVQLGDPPVDKGLRRRHRWTIGRVTTALAIILIAIPIGLSVLDPPVRGPGTCGSTPDNFALAVGLFLLAARPSWLLLKALNDAGERAFTALTGRDDYAPTIPSISDQDPNPLDDP